MSRRLDYAREEQVVGGQALVARAMRRDNADVTLRLSDAVARADALAAKIGIASRKAGHVTEAPRVAALRTELPAFAALVAAAPPDASLADALDGDEIDAALARLHTAGVRPSGETSLDRWDWAVAGTAGLLAGVATLSLVGLPKKTSEAKLFDRWVRGLIDGSMTSGRRKWLENTFRVPFDASTNRKLVDRVEGLYPRSHRLQSLGHDPMLGWIFGVRDVMNGSFTAIGKDGRLVVQNTAEAFAGQNLFVGLTGAFRTVGGHMLSDVSTKAGLPAPLMPLAQFLQFGSFGKKKRNVSDVARFMYLQGYDFRHFVAGSLAAAIVEVIVRGAWIARRLGEGVCLHEALPDAAVPRLRRQLILGHATACAVNAGRIAVTHNPMALNWAQWLAMLRHVAPELAHDLREPERRAAAEDALLDADLRALVQARCIGFQA